jgi:hypothetical protein
MKSILMFESHNNIAVLASDYLTENASMDTGCVIFRIKDAVDIDTPSSDLWWICR